ncbi:DUF1015 family protein [Clostridium tertium]
MKINAIEKSYLNISGNICDSEFINLINIKNDRISFNKEICSLLINEKRLLKNQKIESFDNAIYIFKYKNTYGVICDLPIDEYNNGKVKRHELIIPDKIEGILNNLNSFNCETSPILLGHNKNINYLSYIKEKKYKKNLILDNIEIYVFCDQIANEILNEFLNVDKFYIADGHHRLYSTFLSKFKKSILSCLINFKDLDILPIHRIIPSVDGKLFKEAKNLIQNNFNVLPFGTPLTQGRIRMIYNNDRFVVELKEINSGNIYNNNDIYKLNFQIISGVFSIFDAKNLKFISDYELRKGNVLLGEKDVLIETYPIGKNDFIKSVNNEIIMQPKTTCFYPKFPSFLIFKVYKD